MTGGKKKRSNARPRKPRAGRSVLPETVLPTADAPSKASKSLLGPVLLVGGAIGVVAIVVATTGKNGAPPAPSGAASAVASGPKTDTSSRAAPTPASPATVNPNVVVPTAIAPKPEPPSADAVAATGKACKAGDAKQCYLRALAIESGKTDIRDPGGAVALYDTACAGNVADACARLSEIFQHGDGGVPVDWNKAFDAAKKGCDAESGHACAMLGMVRIMPESGKADAPAALEAFTKACRLGDETGCIGEGRALVRGTDIPQDIASGLKVLTTTCDLGSAFACRVVGQLYRAGALGGPADPAEATRWLSKGCSLGDQICCGTLAPDPNGG